MQDFFVGRWVGEWVGGWVVVFRAACTRASAKFILDRLEKARLNYLLVLEENMRLTSLWNMIGLTTVIYIHFSISIHLGRIENVHILRPVWFGVIDDLNLLYRAVATRLGSFLGRARWLVVAQIESWSASKACLLPQSPRPNKIWPNILSSFSRPAPLLQAGRLNLVLVQLQPLTWTRRSHFFPLCQCPPNIFSSYLAPKNLCLHHAVLVGKV